MARYETERLILRIAWRNVRRNWRHSIAALGTMAVGFVAIALFQGYLGELIESQLALIYKRNMIGEILVRRVGNGTREARIDPERYWLDEADQRFIGDWIAAHAGEVKTRVRSLAVIGMAQADASTAQILLIGHDAAEGRAARREWAWNTWAGRPVHEDAPTGAVLGLGLGAILGCEQTGGDAAADAVIDQRTGAPSPVERPFECKQRRITLTTTSARGRQNALEADVVGLSSANAREFDAMMMWAPLSFAQDLADTRAVSGYMIVLERPADAPRLRADLAAAATRAGLKLDVTDWKLTEQADLFRRGEELLGVYRGLVILVILIIAGAAVLTTMMKTVRERTREVGTLRSLGYRGRQMLAMFAVEAVMLALHAGVIGLAVAAALTAAINGTHVTYKGGLMADAITLRVGYSPEAYALGFLFLSLVAIIAALIAARKVTGMSIASALADG